MFLSIFYFICFIIFFPIQGETAAKEISTNKNIKFNPIEKEILKAKTRKDFERILIKLSLVNPFDDYTLKRTVDAVMKASPSNRLLVFYCVSKFSCSSFNNDEYFEIFSDLSKEDVIELFDAVFLSFPQVKDQHKRIRILKSFKFVPKGKKLKLAKYINRITPYNMENLASFIDKVTLIPEDDLPDVIARVLTIAKSLDDYGIEDLVSSIFYTPKDHRDSIISVANKLSSPKVDTLGKAQLINGLIRLKTEDFSNVIETGQQLFFEDTPGGHRSLILQAIADIKNNNRKNFVLQVKPLLKADDPYMLRLAIIRVLATMEESDRLIFIDYLSPKISKDIKVKIFENLDHLKEKDINIIMSYIKENLSEKPENDEKLLTAILSCIQKINLNI